MPKRIATALAVAILGSLAALVFLTLTLPSSFACDPDRRAAIAASH